jgi:NADPH:quinone reductase-like Zn-dependent oxidoreductase
MGAYAEYLAVKVAVIAKKPSNLSFEEAASVPVAAQTAWHGIFTHGHLEKGQTILIHGVPVLWAPMLCSWRRMPALRR